MPLPQLWTLENALKQPRLPGQLAAESILFRAWAAKRGAAYLYVATNVRLGAGDDPGPSYPDYARRYAIATTQKRADLVAFHETTVDIFEVKVQANLSEIGQLLGYRVLWQAEFPAYPVGTLGVIAKYVNVDTLRVLMGQHISVDLFPDADLPALLEVPAPG